ncbi:heat-shock protein Hsp20 [Methyloprofundus sedimenti]|uniref:Heat-shock protein Hsp20 n=1 Tax=Methyloprofundus sedimenti TaxID=1420851 RepID=A0A1V8M2C0_9GAMM|nr:Hsp20/alpha crystallin family protein [Methyloprofundus sedimenti]OQK15682.1 heat-shock protein Hsp20 [Methyloprofundus sedimenti]
MSDKKEISKKSTDVTPHSSIGGLFSFNEFDDFFDTFLTRRWPRVLDWNAPMEAFEKSFPKVDIIDHDKEIEVQAALPGVKKEDLDISIHNQLLTIKASHKTETEEKKDEGKYFRREISRGEFQRTVALPDSVDNENVSASFNDGILTVTIPKCEKSKCKNIEVK